MTTRRRQYIAGEGFTGDNGSPRRWHWLLLLLLAAALVSAWFLLSGKRSVGVLVVTSAQDDIPIQINLAPAGAVTPALLELPARDSLTVSLLLEDQLTLPSHYRLQIAPGETVAVHFLLQPLQEAELPQQPGADEVNTAAQRAIPAMIEQERSRPERSSSIPPAAVPSELLLPESDNLTRGIFLRSNLSGVTWRYGDRELTATGNQLVLADSGSEPLIIIPHLEGHQFSPGSLEVVPSQLTDPYLYFHGQIRTELTIFLKSEPALVTVLLHGQELGRTPLTLQLEREATRLEFTVPPGFLIPPPLELAGLENGTLITLHLEQIREMAWDCTRTAGISGGYVMPDEEILLDDQNDRERNGDQCYWKLGPQSLSRRPHGSRALLFEFNLPEYDHDHQGFRLRILGFDSEDNYPFTFRNFCSLTVRINGSSLLEEVEVTGDTLTPTDQGWDISRYLEPGDNRLVVQVGEGSLRYFLLQGVRVTPYGTTF